MTTRFSANRRHASRAGASRRAQGGAAARGAIVAVALVAAVVLQVAGPRLQCRLAGMTGIDAMAPAAAPVMRPAPMPACGSPSGANPMHPCKIAFAVVGTAPVM